MNKYVNIMKMKKTITPLKRCNFMGIKNNATDDKTRMKIEDDRIQANPILRHDQQNVTLPDNHSIF